MSRITLSYICPSAITKWFHAIFAPAALLFGAITLISGRCSAQTQPGVPAAGQPAGNTSVLAIDAQNPTTMYDGPAGADIWKSNDGGGTCRSVYVAPPSDFRFLGIHCHELSASRVQWNEASRDTTFFGSTQLTAAISVNDIATAGSASVTVFNPAPGGGTSNAPTFAISNPPISITVTTNLGYGTIIVDGTRYTAPQSFNWTPGDQHIIATDTPQVGMISRYLFASWSDGGTISHSITVPTTATTYTANFTTQYLLNTTLNPSDGGTIVANPNSPDGYYDSGASVRLTAVPNQGYTFTNWSGDLNGSANPQSVTMSAFRSVTANFSTSPITVTTNPTGLTITVDGTSYIAPQMFNWSPGSQHTIAASGLQGSGGTRYILTSWSDGGYPSHNITAPATATSYTANFRIEYLLTTSVTPADGGAIAATSPSSSPGYYSSGTQVQLTATPNKGFIFTAWIGDLTGSTNPQSLTMSSARSVTASFSPLPPSEMTEWDGDFDGDGKSDILWRNSTTGQLYIWLMDGTGPRMLMDGIDPVAIGCPGVVADLGWQIIGLADFNGDGKTDILWRHQTTGQLYIWLMDGINLINLRSPMTVSDLSWRIEQIGDFNGDGKADLLWRNATTGQLYIWLMNGLDLMDLRSPMTVSDLSWQIQGLGDFNGDGRKGILWRNATTGDLYIWLMNGLSPTIMSSPGSVSDLDWQIQALADFNGDGKTDILWYYKKTGQVYIWLMDGVNFAMGSPGTMSDLNWQIKGVADFSGDGKADILWRNSMTGQISVWFVDGTHTTVAAPLGTVLDPRWQIDSFGNFNGDNKTDIFWRNGTTGQLYVWLMNGILPPLEASPGTVSDKSWKIQK